MKDSIDSPLYLNLKVVILAGGLGTRLGLLTKRKPKVLISVGGLSVLEWALNWCFENHLREENTGISLFHKSQDIRQHVEIVYPDNSFMFQLQEFNLGTAGALKKLTHWLSTTFVVINGDTITDVNLNEMLIYHFKHNPVVTVFTHDDALHTGGVYVFDSSVLDLIPEESFSDIKTNLMPLLVNGGYKIGLFRDLAASYADIGTPNGLKKARSNAK